MPSDRDILFSNESFLIGVLQAVSGGSLIAAIAQFQSLRTVAGLVAVLLFMTFMTVGLAAAVVAAFCKHHYKMWDVKATASLAKDQREEAQERSRKFSAYLDGMRGAMAVAFVAILASLCVLIAAFWLHGFRSV